MSSVPEGIRAVRYGVALSRMEHVQTLRLSGSDAIEVLDFLCPRELFLHDGQVLQGLIVDREGIPVADLLVGSEGEEFLLLAEVADPELDLVGWTAERIPEGLSYELKNTTAEVTHLALSGPYAWELLAGLLGSEVIGLPYLSFFNSPVGLCIRGGKTGEFGYDLLVPPDRIEGVTERLADLGRAFDLADASLDELDLCGLENGFFNIRREGAAGKLTPIELQLQWRLSRYKSYLGSEALAERRQSVRQRTVSICSDAKFEVGDELREQSNVIGTVVSAMTSLVRGDRVGLALTDTYWAHPGLRFEVGPPRGETRGRLETVSPPLLNNRSLFVSPQKHTYATREEYAFPPLVD